jgi:hypothetical protein
MLMTSCSFFYCLLFCNFLVSRRAELQPETLDDEERDAGGGRDQAGLPGKVQSPDEPRI